jgi:phosphatidylglycerophosphate synthase
MATKPWDSRLARAAILPLCHTRVHPNHVTTVALATGLVAAALYATATRVGADIGAACWVVASILDHADGELARLTGKVSEFGHRYDRAADLIVKLALFAGLGASLRHGPLQRWDFRSACSAGRRWSRSSCRAARWHGAAAWERSSGRLSGGSSSRTSCMRSPR